MFIFWCYVIDITDVNFLLHIQQEDFLAFLKLCIRFSLLYLLRVLVMFCLRLSLSAFDFFYAVIT